VVTVRTALAGNKPARLKDVAADLVALKVDLIVTHSVSPRAAKEVTKPVPILMADSLIQLQHV